LNSKRKEKEKEKEKENEKEIGSFNSQSRYADSVLRTGRRRKKKTVDSTPNASRIADHPA
jgi:hypothetical protein